MLAGREGHAPVLRELAVVAKRMVDERGRTLVASDRYLAKTLAVDDLRVRPQRIVVLNPLEPDLPGVERGGKLGTRTVPDLRRDRPRVAVALGIAVDAVERSQGIAVERLRHLGRLVHGDRDVPVGHPIHTVGRVVVPAPDVAVAREDVPLHVAREVLGERLGLEIDPGVEEAALDPGALAGLEAAHVAGKHPHGEQGPAVLIDDRRPDRGRADLVVGGDRHQPRARLHQQVLTRAVLHRPRRTETRRGCVHDFGLAAAQGLVSEAEPIHHPRTKVLHHHVGPIDEPIHDLLRGRLLEVDGEASLVAVGAHQKGADAVHI